MADLIAEFCSWYHAYHKISPERAIDQQRVLRRLETFLAGTPITQLTARDLEAFLGAGDHAPTTVGKYLKMVRPFLAWLWQHKHMSAEQLMELQAVRAPRGSNGGLPKPYTRRQIAEFWEYVDEAFPWTLDDDLRDITPRRAEMFVKRWQSGVSPWKRVWPYARRLQVEAIVSLALYGGLRRVEIFNLELEDMHWDNAFVRVHGARKNPEAESRPRAVPMPNPMRAALAHWIEFRDQVLKPEHDRPWLCLWRDRYLEPMKPEQLRDLLSKVGPGFELHRMRHTFATERLRAGMRIEKLQRIMGHADIEMTLRYAQISDEDVLAAAAETDEKFVSAVQPSHA